MPLFPKGCNAFNVEITFLSVRAQFQRTESTPTSSSRKGFTAEILLRGLSSHWEGKSKLKTRLSGTTHKATLQIVSHWENCYLSWHQEISTFTTVPPLEQSETKFSPHISHSQILKKNERPRSHRHPCFDNVSCTRADPELLTNLDTDYTGSSGACGPKNITKGSYVHLAQTWWRGLQGMRVWPLRFLFPLRRAIFLLPIVVIDGEWITRQDIN